MIDLMNNTNMMSMENVWIVYIWSPYLIPLIGTVLQALLLIGVIWFPNTDLPKNRKKQLTLYLLINGMKFVYGFFGMMLLEISIMWLLGPWGYADWRYQLPKILLGIIIGVEFIWGYLSRAKIYDYLVIVISTGVYLYFLLKFLPSIYNFRPIFGNFAWILIVGLGIILICAYLDKSRIQTYIEMNSKIDQKSPLNPPIHLYDHIYSRKVMIGILIFSMIEAFLFFYGYSLLSW